MKYKATFYKVRLQTKTPQNTITVVSAFDTHLSWESSEQFK
jgi:hypothetical protein